MSPFELCYTLSPFSCNKQKHTLIKNITFNKVGYRHVRQIPPLLTIHDTFLSHLAMTRPSRFLCVYMRSKDFTYQHLAKYMCSLTKTDPESRIYQQVAMVSGLRDDK